MSEQQGVSFSTCWKCGRPEVVPEGILCHTCQDVAAKLLAARTTGMPRLYTEAELTDLKTRLTEVERLVSGATAILQKVEKLDSGHELSANEAAFIRSHVRDWLALAQHQARVEERQ